MGSRGDRRIDVAGDVADHNALVRRNLERRKRLFYQSRLRFSASAAVGAGVRADEPSVERPDAGFDARMHCVHLAHCGRIGSCARLIRHDAD